LSFRPAEQWGHEFIGLPNLGIPDFYFASTFISADGKTVVGSNSAIGFRWTREDGMVPLGSVPGQTTSVEPRAISADGSVIVGLGYNFHSFRWTQETGPVGMDLDHIASGVSGDGTIIVGGSSAGAYYWTEETGNVRFGPGAARGISGDGRVIVGVNSSGAFRWTAEDGFESLGDGVAYAASTNGAVIVGGGGSSNQAFRWTESDGMMRLGTLPGTTSSGASAVSSDGSIVVGSSLSGDVNDPYVWDATHGMRNLQDVLVSDFGLADALAGWDLRKISMDATGRVFAGTGRHNGISRPWVVYLDRPINSAPTTTWNVDANGIWNVGSSWTLGVPNAVGKEALLGNIITQPRTITLNSPATLGRLDFDSTHGYTIGGTNALTLDAGTGSANVNVVSGSHSITAPLTLADNSVFTVTPPASNLSITGTLSASGKSLTKAGAGTLTLNNLRAAALGIDGGTVAIAANGTNAATSVLKTISIAGDTTPTARLDLNNNAAIIDHTGTSPAATVRQQILAARGAPGLGQTWNGNGITSSTVAAANAAEPESRSIAYAENSGLPLGPFTTFRGQPVDETALLIAYTRTGDANLDGLVNDDDVTIVGASYAPGVSQPHWALGDFDYNGFVDDDDVTLLGAFYDPSATALSPPVASDDSTWRAEPEAEVSAVAAVPEPGTLISAATAGILLALFVVPQVRRATASRLCHAAIGQSPRRAR
jgi:uncharacterized membrane protein